MGFLPRDVKIVGYARTKMDTAEYHKRITSYLKVADDDEDGQAKIAEFKPDMLIAIGTPPPGLP